MIYHITQNSAWKHAANTSAYHGDTLLSEGFIHCSELGQLLNVANTRFLGQHDLIILCIDEQLVDQEIRYENLEGGSSLFPHIYGPLNTNAVACIASFPPGEDGTFRIPPDVGK